MYVRLHPIAAAGTYVAITAPVANSVFSTGVAGTIDGIVSPAGAPVNIHDADTSALIGAATVVGPYWQFLWTSTVADYGIVNIDARSPYATSAPLPVSVVTWPHTLLSALNFYYGWLGYTLGTGPTATKLLHLNSYGSMAEAVSQATPANAPDVTTNPALYGGHQYINYGAVNDATLFLRSSGAVLTPQPLTLMWHGIRTGAPGSGKIVLDSQAAANRYYLASNAANNWSLYAGTVAIPSNAPTNAFEQTVIGRLDGANSRLDYLDSADAWNVGATANAGANGIQGVTTNRYTAPAGATLMGNNTLFWGTFLDDPNASQRTQITRWRRKILQGLPFRLGSGAWLSTPAGVILTTAAGEPLTLE